MIEGIVKRAQQGDKLAFSQLVESQYDYIYKVAFKWCGNIDDSQEITQEICIKLATAIDKFKPEYKFSTWLYRVVINHAKDFYRKQNRRSGNELPLEDGVEFSDNISPERQLQAKQLYALVYKLPTKLQDAMLLVYAEGLSHAEVGNVLQVKEATISWRVHEGKKQLQKIMDKHGLSKAALTSLTILYLVIAYI